MLREGYVRMCVVGDDAFDCLAAVENSPAASAFMRRICYVVRGSSETDRLVISNLFARQVGNSYSRADTEPGGPEEPQRPEREV